MAKWMSDALGIFQGFEAIASPLLWLALTLGVYALFEWVSRRAGHKVWLHPFLWSLITLAALLSLTRTPYERYFAETQFLHFMLGPATVALAIPIVEFWDRILKAFIPIMLSLILGSTSIIICTLALGLVLHLPDSLLLNMAPKSATTPIAIAIVTKLEGSAALAAIFVLACGLMGAILGPAVMSLCRIRSLRAQGFAMGLVSHGIGTGRAFQIDPVMGTLSGIAMALNGALTALLVPWILKLMT
jgi:putative effector of murein hydrolase